MAKKAIRVQDDGVLDYTAAAAIAVGDVVPLGSTCVGIAKTSIAVGETGALDTSGLFDVAAETGTAWSIGDVIYWDATNNVATKTATGNTRMGIASLAKLSATATGQVLLTKGGPIAQAEMQADSTASTIAAAVVDLNALLAKLKAAGLMASA